MCDFSFVRCSCVSVWRFFLSVFGSVLFIPYPQHSTTLRCAYEFSNDLFVLSYCSAYYSGTPVSERNCVWFGTNFEHFFFFLKIFQLIFIVNSCRLPASVEVIRNISGNKTQINWFVLSVRVNEVEWLIVDENSNWILNYSFDYRLIRWMNCLREGRPVNSNLIFQWIIIYIYLLSIRKTRTIHGKQSIFTLFEWFFFVCALLYRCAVTHKLWIGEA